MSPAPTITTVVDAVIATASESAPDLPALLVTVTRTLPMPSVGYTCEAVIGAVCVVVLPVAAGDPSPQVIEYDHGASFAPGSLNVTASFTVSPGCAVRSGPAFTNGAGGGAA